jgi:ATP-dependent helicase/nuclease subunit A
LCGLAHYGQLQKILASDLPLREAASRLFDVRLYGQDKLDELSELIDSMRPVAAERRTAAPKRRGKPKSGGLAAVKKSLGWRYRFADDPRLPAKRSVTQWTHRNDEFVRFDYSSALQRLPKAIGAERVDSRTIGTATHLVISHIDLRRPVTGDAVEQVMARLAADGAITQQVCDKIDARSIAGFFETEPGRAALDVKNGVLREWPFTFTIPGGEFVIAERRRPAVSDERIIVQGVIDMLIRTPAGLLVVDFKTDNVTGDEAVQRAEMYREQLDFYARAAGTILNCGRPAKYLYFLIPAKLVKL